MRTKRIAALFLTIFLMIGALLPISGCFLFEPTEVEIVKEYTRIENGGTGFAVYAKIKNPTSSTITTSFKVNVYKNGEVIDSAYSSVITLGAGEIGTVSSISSILGYGTTGLSHKITGWNYY